MSFVPDVIGEPPNGQNEDNTRRTYANISEPGLFKEYVVRRKKGLAPKSEAKDGNAEEKPNSPCDALYSIHPHSPTLAL
jgi:hypothetical protein